MSELKISLFGIGVRLKNFIPALTEAKELLDKPATKQLLINHVKSSTVLAERHTFINHLNSIGNLDIDHIALANGAIDATQIYSPATTFFSIDINSGQALSTFTSLDPSLIKVIGLVAGTLAIGARVQMDLKALPTFSNSFTEFGKIKIALFILGNLIIGHSQTAEVKNRLPIDGAPGGVIGSTIPTAVLSQITAAGGTILDPNQFAFVPAFSALNLESPFNEDLSIDLSDIEQVLGDEITLVSRYSGSTDDWPVYSGAPAQRNQYHVTFYADNVGEILSELDVSSYSSSVDFSNFSSIYNFGKNISAFNARNIAGYTADQITKNVNIESNGIIHIGKNAPVADMNILNPVHDESGFVVVVHLGCDEETAIKVYEEGSLHVGDKDDVDYQGELQFRLGTKLEVLLGGEVEVNSNSKLIFESESECTIFDEGFLDAKLGAQVILNEGSEMRVKSGGTLRISDNSSLIIESGATLILEDGAVVQLWDGQNPDGRALIEVRGTLQVEGDILFSGNGFFDFYGGHQISITSNTFELTGYAPNYRLFRVNDTILNLTQNHLIFNDFKIELIDAGIVNAGNNKNVMMDGINFSGIDHTSTGLFVDGHRRIHVQDCRFEDLYDGLAIHSNNGVFPGYHTIIDRTDFISNSTGVIINEMDQAYVRHCNFEGNEESVLIGDLNQMYFLSSDFSTNTSGIVVWGSLQGQRIVVDNSVFFQNGHGLISFEGGKFNLILRNGTTLEENIIGVRMPGSGMEPYDLDYGILIMDCAKLINNDTAVVGTDIVLMIDAYTNSHTDDPDYVRSNHFECNTSTQKLFKICYDNRTFSNMNPIPARGNYWSFTVPVPGPTVPWIIRDCSGSQQSAQNPFIYTGYTEEEPEGCPSRLIEIDTEFEDCILFQGTIEEIDIAEEYFEGMKDWREQIDSMAYNESGDWYAHFETIYSYDPLDTTMTDVCKYYIYTSGAFATGSLSFGNKPFHGSNNPDVGNNTFDVYPNPFNSNEPVNLFYNAGKSLELELLNVQGTVVFKRKLALSESLMTLKLPDLPAGVYVLKYIDIESGESGYQILTKL